MTTLTSHDRSILDKIHDPESSSSSPLVIDAYLPRDPHITDPTRYSLVSSRERSVIASLESAELSARPSSHKPPPLHEQYLSYIRNFDELIAQFPEYASLRNNRAQCLRRVYGDGVLVKSSPSAEDKDQESSPPLDPSASDDTLLSAGLSILTDLSTAISLLTPRTPFAPISPPAARTLSQAHTQLGALYHLTAKRLATKDASLRIDQSRREAQWHVVDFEENASREFMLGGRYGNEVAKALAVSANPTAKLCGEMVKEAMRKEYGGGQA
jgi:hypothetical protein